MNNQSSAKPLVKICGINNINAALATARSGADFIGLIFHPASRRNVDLDTAKNIVSAIKHEQSTIKIVGVFVDQSATEIINICDRAAVDIVQLHGNNAKNALKNLPRELIKILVINLNYDGSISNHNEIANTHYLDVTKDFILFDSFAPGTGQTVCFDNFKTNTDFRFFLAGGLKVNNVATAINAIKPFAVDVATGVEDSRGNKDIALIKQFIKQVKNSFS